MSKSKRIVLATLGSYGDIHPYMAIAMELRARGQQPVIATSELYREKMQAAGFDFVAVRPNIPPPQEQDPVMMEKVMHPRSGSGYLLNEMLFPFLREGYEDLLQAVAGADLLLTHPITFAGPLVAQATGIPWVSSVLAPVSFMSAYDPPVPPFWPWMRHVQILGPRFVAAFFQQVKKVYKNKTYDEFRAELGLADRGSPVFEGQHSPTLILALFSKVFAEPQPDWPPQARATGFAFYDGRNELEMPPELELFLDDGAPPIVFTLGSSAVWVARDFYRESIAAAKSLGRRAVLLIGDDRNRLPESLPPGMIAVNYAPFEALLPRACAMVHHGGVGTTSQGLRAGIPTLIVPFAFDQPDNAAHAARLGCSRTLPRMKYKAERIAKELDTLLGMPDYADRANEIGKQLRTENGAAAACDLIEQVLQGDREASCCRRLRNPLMLLVIDAGNTNTSLGVFKETELVAHWRLTTARARTVDEYGVHARNLFELAGIDFKAIDAIAIASVVPPLNYTLKTMAESYFHLTPLFVDHTTAGLTILYEPAADVGSDRIVDAVAAIQKYGAPCIVVDFGTATTFNAINAKGEYVGGVITPGIMISSDALFERTAKLPRVDIRRPQTIIGSSTIAAMQSGLYHGFVGLVDGVLRKMIDEIGGKPRVIATGGLASLIATGSEFIELVDDTLTLEGLRLIYERTQLHAV